MLLLSFFPWARAKNNKLVINILTASLTMVLFGLTATAQAQVKGTWSTQHNGKPLTPAQWRADLQFALDTFLPRDRSFSPDARKQFTQTVVDLQKTVEKKSDEQIIVELAKAVALAKNAHTRLYLLRNRSELRRYPIRVWWFPDGLYVVKSTPEYSDLLGTRIEKIAGRDAAQVKRDVAPLYAGNASWRTYISAYTMTSPEVLIGLGLIGSDGSVRVHFTGRRKGTRVLTPLPLRRSNQASESWWDLCPTRQHEEGKWLSVPSLVNVKLPLYLKDTEKQYWAQLLPDSNLYYVQFNRSTNAPTGPSLKEFGERAINELRSTNVGKIVVDVRFNTGGDLTIGRPFIDQLAQVAKERKLKVYVITGRATFSAGLFHALQLRHAVNAIIVGESFGDELDFWSEGGNLLAPNSGLTLHYADRFHAMSSVDYPEHRQYLVNDTDLSINCSEPDILITTSVRDYFAGRDPALEAITRFSGSGPTRSRCKRQ